MKNIIALAVVLSCATAAMAQSYLTPSGPYPYPGQPNNPPPYNPPPNNPPGQPPYNPPGQPPYSGISCKLEYTGNYYYISRNGTRFTELTSSLQQALNQKQQLVSQGMCSNYSQDNGKCDLEYTGNYYYVSRNGARIADLTSNLQQALNTRDLLYRAQECNYQTYQPTTSCAIEYTGNYYYVSRNGTRFTNLTSSLQQVTNEREQLVRNYVCQSAYQYAPCRLEYTGNYYYISINSSRATELTQNLDQILRQQQDLASRGMCSTPQATEQCRVDYTGNYYYVSRNGSRISDLKQDYYIANQIMYSLQSSRNCY
jgi:hypothetical protein